MTTDLTRRGSIPGAMAWMIGLSILLSWIPIFGGLIAGYVGGSKAGSVGRAVAAVFLPGLIMWGTMIGLVAGLLLLAGGLPALQTASTAIAVPFSVVLLLMMVGLSRSLFKSEGNKGSKRFT